MSELEDIYFLHGTWVFSIGLCCVLRNKIGVAFGSAWFKSLQASSAAVSHVFCFIKFIINLFFHCLLHNR